MNLSAHQITLSTGSKMGWVEYSALDTDIYNVVSMSRKASALFNRGAASCQKKGWYDENLVVTVEGRAAWNEYAKQA